MADWDYESRFSTASGNELPYVVMQVTLKEKFIGTGSGNLSDLEEVINQQVKKGYRLHTITTSNGGSKGIGGGDRIQATLVFERLDIEQVILKYAEKAGMVRNVDEYIEKIEKKEQENNDTDQNVSKKIDPVWFTDDPFWIQCPGCGQKMPRSYADYNDYCPSCQRRIKK